MKIIVKSNELKKLITDVKALLTKGVETLIKFETIEGKLIASIESAYFAFSRELNADIIEEGSIKTKFVALQQTCNIIRGRTPDISLDSADDKLSIFISGATYTIPLASEEVRKFETVEYKDSFIMSATEFNYILKKLPFAMGHKSDTRGLNVLHICSEEDTRKIVAVATSGHAMVEYTSNTVANEEFEPINIPDDRVKAMQVILKGIDTGDIEINSNGEQLKLTHNNTSVAFKISNAEYVDYKRVIESASGNETIINVKNMRDMIKRATASICGAEKNKQIKLTLNAKGLIVHSRDDNGAEFTDIIGATWDEDPIEIGFFSKLILDTLTSAGDGDAVFLFYNKMQPVFIRPKNNDRLIYCVTPCRLK